MNWRLTLRITCAAGLFLLAAARSLTANNYVVNGLGRAGDAVADATLPTTYQGLEMLYSSTRSDGGWTEAGLGSLGEVGAFPLFHTAVTTLRLGELGAVGGIRFLGVQSGDDYLVWKLGSWTLSEGDTLWLIHSRLFDGWRSQARYPEFLTYRPDPDFDVNAVGLYGWREGPAPDVPPGYSLRTASIPRQPMPAVVPPVIRVPDDPRMVILLVMGVGGLFLLSRASRSSGH